MKILMITTKFFHKDGSLWLTSELAKEFLKNGHHLTVINLEWTNLEEENKELLNHENLKLIKINPIKINIKGLNQIVKWFFTSFKTFPFFIKSILNRERFDLFICFSACFPTYTAIPLAHLISKKSLLIYWDFFPVHNFKIINPKLLKYEKIFKFIEKKLVHSFDRVGLMSQYNIDFYKKYFGKTKKQTLEVLPLWTSYLESMPKINLEKYSKNLKNSIVVVFGGQLSKGRSIIELCKATIEANKMNSKIKLLILGSGILYDEIKKLMLKYPDIIVLIDFVPRSEYLQIISSCDVGIVATDSSVDSPSYPSKSLDYMVAKLPIIAAVEEATDFGDILVANNIGLKCKANDILDLKKSILFLANDSSLRYKMGNRAQEFLLRTHSIKEIINQIIKEV